MRVRCERSDTSVWRVHLEPGDAEEVALDGDGLARLDSVLAEAGDAPQCRVIIIESAAGVFCRGLDLGYLLAHAGEDHSERIGVYASCMERLRTSSRATICLVDGVAQGGGVGLVACADAVIATQRSTFSLPECVLGLIPAMVMPLLCRRMPVQKARWMAISSRQVKASEAVQLGLVDQCVEGPIELEMALRATVKQLLRASPRAVARLKSFTDDVEGRPCGEGLEAGADRTAKDLLELETITAIRAFLAGESPAWFERYKSGGRNG